MQYTAIGGNLAHPTIVVGTIRGVNNCISWRNAPKINAADFCFLFHFDVCYFQAPVLFSAILHELYYRLENIHINLYLKT